MQRTEMSFFRDKRILITGHTGFKGSWLSRILIDAGAKVTGVSLEPPTSPSIFSICRLENQMDSVIGDVRDFELLKEVFERVQPQIVIHLAAQPIVRESYKNPRETYETNVMGTVNILECARQFSCVRSFLNVTTDKVYENKEWEWGYREEDVLDGFDPYSNSKSCSELVTHSYIRSFFADSDTAVSTARAGNVIGGGDFASDRIIPDCYRSAVIKQSVTVRNPYSIRPYQHVLEPLFLYLTIVKKQWEDPSIRGYYNVGPDDCDCVDTGTLTTLFCKSWGRGMQWQNKSDGGPHEAGFLKLDCSRVRRVFGWKPTWHIEKAVAKSVEWYQLYNMLITHLAEPKELADKMNACMREQIRSFLTAVSYTHLTLPTICSV